MDIQTEKMIKDADIDYDDYKNRYYIGYDNYDERRLFLNIDNQFIDDGEYALVFSEEYYAQIYLNLLKQNIG